MEKFLAYGFLVGILAVWPAIVCQGQCSRVKREPVIGIFLGLILGWFGVLLLALTLPSPDGKRSKLARLAGKRRNNASGSNPAGSGPVLPTISELSPLQQPAPQPQTLPVAASYLRPPSQILPKLSSASYKALNLPLRPSSNITPKLSSGSYRALNLPLRPPTTTVPKLNSGSYRALNLPVRSGNSSGSHRAMNLPLRTGNSSASYRALNIPLRPSGMSSATYRTINLPLRNRVNSVVPKPTSNTTIFVTMIAVCVFGLGLFLIGGSKSTKPIATVTPAEIDTLEANRLAIVPIHTASGGTKAPSVTSREDLEYVDFLRRSKAQRETDIAESRSPFQTRPDSNREANARAAAASESLAVAANDPRGAELKARAEREAQVDAELQRSRTLSPASPSSSTSSPSATPVAGIDGAVGITTAAFSSNPDADARVAELKARAALEAQSELDAGEQTPGDMKKPKPAPAARVTVSNAETPAFIEATSNTTTGSVSRFATGKGDLEVKRQAREQQAAAEKALADLVKEGTMAILKTRLATAELNRSNLIQNPPEAVQKSAQNGVVPAKDESGDIAQWTLLVKRADDEIANIKREMQKVDSK